MHIFDELKERGLVFQTTDEKPYTKTWKKVRFLIILIYDPTLLTAFTLVTWFAILTSLFN